MLKVEKCFWCSSSDLKKVAERKDGVGINECQKCKLLLVSEMPEDLSEYYDEEEYFNPHGETETGYHENYDLISPFYLYWQGAIVEEIARRGNKKSLLEVGCATGNAMEMIKIFNENLVLHGLDLSSYAIRVCKGKGLSASVSKIDDYKAKNKFDMILSSETMEHVDALWNFIEGVKNNLTSNGIYIFYVPAVDRERLIKESQNYPSLTTSLEHLSYFTKSFLEKALADAFKGFVYLHQINAAGDNYHLGFVSSDKKLIDYMKKFSQGFERYDSNFSDSNTLYNLVTIAAKFSNFAAAEKYLKKLGKPDIPAQKLKFLNGLLSYSKGELIKSKEYFNTYLENSVASNFILKVLLSVDREYNKLLINESAMLKQQVEQINHRMVTAEAELKDFKQSKIVGNAIRLRRVVGASLDPIRRFKKKIKPQTIKLLRRIIPYQLRGPLKYLVTLQWRIKHIEVKNNRIPDGQPLVSVIIPYYNRGSTIDETIESLRWQTFKNFEVLVVDDGSTEQLSIEKSKHLDFKGLHAEVISQQNRGVAAARNNGISKSRGQYIICLDSDDLIDPTYIEKCVLLLETDPNIDLVTTDMKIFGVTNMVYKQGSYNPLNLIENNMVTTASMFDKEGWQKVGGYKSAIGYEDWEFWVNLAEHGYWGVNLPEPLFNYRTALASRYTEDLADHEINMQKVRELHPNYKRKIKKLQKIKKFNHKYVSRDSLFANLNNPHKFQWFNNENENILITIPWMTFGGAETLIHNYCLEVKDKFNISFVTGWQSGHEWEYKFKEITPYIYHLANLYGDQNLYTEFISNFIITRDISVLHIIHNGFTLPLLPEIKQRHPALKVVVTMFNDRVEYFEQSTKYEKYIDAFVTDNNKVANHYKQKLKNGVEVRVIPNGINSNDIYNPILYNRQKQRAELGLKEKDLAVFFMGRLAEEKNPDVFLEVAEKVVKDHNNIHFFVVGDGVLAPQVKSKVAQINNKNVRYLGYQSEIARYLCSADIFVLPSSIEGFPLSILEAMAMKVAVIASDVGAVSDVIDTEINGFVVNPGDVREIAERIVTLVNDRQLLDEVKNAARQKIEKKYSNIVLGQNYKKLYRDFTK